MIADDALGGTGTASQRILFVYSSEIYGRLDKLPPSQGENK